MKNLRNLLIAGTMMYALAMQGAHAQAPPPPPPADQTPATAIGIAGIVVEPTDNLLKLQQKLIDAVAPFTVKTGTAAAFVTTPEDPDINQPTIDYIAAFVPKASGEHFNPHVTVGIATQEYLKA